jgi:hypothetical protein
MSLLAELTELLATVALSCETGVFSGIPPDEYVVLTPLTDEFAVFADNKPLIDVSEVRVSLFTKGNYLLRAAAIVSALFAADITVTERRYNGYETDSGYHNYSVDAAKSYTYGG